MDMHGIAQLKADLRTNATHYNQNDFVITTPECGTEMCMAGMCLMRKTGKEEFDALVAKYPKNSQRFNEFVDMCLLAGAEQLGIELLSQEEYEDLSLEAGLDGDTLPAIFSKVSNWPDDLREEYEEYSERHNHIGMAEVACAALDRIDDNGTFV